MASPPPRPRRPAPTPAGRRLAGGDRYVLALGTVEPRKDLPSLVAAFDALAADDPDLRLVLAGPDGLGRGGPHRGRAGPPHRRRIVRLGWVDDDQRLALLRGASVVAYPSRYEGFGFVPLEAMAGGHAGGGHPRPVRVPEVVGDAALLVPPGDADALAGALRDVLGDDGVRERLVTARSERVRTVPVARHRRWPRRPVPLGDPGAGGEALEAVGVLGVGQVLRDQVDELLAAVLEGRSGPVGDAAGGCCAGTCRRRRSPRWSAPSSGRCTRVSRRTRSTSWPR